MSKFSNQKPKTIVIDGDKKMNKAIETNKILSQSSLVICGWNIQ